MSDWESDDDYFFGDYILEDRVCSGFSDDFIDESYNDNTGEWID